MHAITAAVAAFCLFAVPAAGAALRIVTPATPALPEQFAARELARYLAAMGNPAPVVAASPAPGDLYIGVLPSALPPAARQALASRLRGQDPDSFALHSFPGGLVILGNSPRAHLYGVYGYLESLGARWYFPGPENEIIPRAAARLDGYDTLEAPSFRKRGLCVFATTPGFAELADFAAKARLNTIGLHTLPSLPPFGDAGYEAAAKAIGPRGLAIDIERHFFGERFCPDDRATLAREQANFRRYIAALPASMQDFFLWAADKYLPPCRSPQYRDYTVSDIVLWFSNQMAATLRETRPRGRFAFLAYLGTEEPPAHVKPAPGVFLEWAPIRQSFAHGIDDPASATSRRYRENFEAHLKLFNPAEAQVLGYWLDDTLFSRTHYGRLPYNPEAMRADLAWYHGRGVRAVTTFGVITGRDYFASHASPAVFLYPLLLWDIHADPRAAVREFCRRYFGSAEASAIFDRLAEADRLVYVDDGNVQAARANDPRFLRAASAAVDEARRLMDAQTEPALRARAARLVQEAAARLAQIGRQL